MKNKMHHRFITYLKKLITQLKNYDKFIKEMKTWLSLMQFFFVERIANKVFALWLFLFYLLLILILFFSSLYYSGFLKIISNSIQSN